MRPCLFCKPDINYYFLAAAFLAGAFFAAAFLAGAFFAAAFLAGAFFTAAFFAGAFFAGAFFAVAIVFPFHNSGLWRFASAFAEVKKHENQYVIISLPLLLAFIIYSATFCVTLQQNTENENKKNISGGFFLKQDLRLEKKTKTFFKD